MAIRSVSRSVMATLIAAAAAACNGGGDGQSTGNTMPGEPDASVPTDPMSETDANITVDATTEVDATTVVDSGDEVMKAEHGLTCGDAIALSNGTIVRGANTPVTGVGSTACRPSDAPQRFFALDIPAGQRATITIDPTDWIAVGRVLVSCDATMCISDGQSDEAGDVVTLVVDNTETDVLHKIVSVSGLANGEGGTFDIVATLTPIGTSTDGGTMGTDGGTTGSDGGTTGSDGGTTGSDGGTSGGDSGTTGPMCSLSTQRALIGPSDSFSESVLAAGATHQLTGTCISSTGTDRIFPFHLDTASMVELRVSQTNGDFMSAGLSIRTACADAATSMGCNRDYDMFGDALLRRNLAPGDYYAIFDWNGSTRATTYTLAYHTYPSVPNATCDAAIPVHDGSTLTGQLGSSGGQNDSDCLGMYRDPPQPILWYAATVPAGQTLTATSTATGIGSTRLSLMNYCPGSGPALNLCLSSNVDAPRTSQTYTNTGSTPANVTIAVIGSVTFDLAVSIR